MKLLNFASFFTTRTVYKMALAILICQSLFIGMTGCQGKIANESDKFFSGTVTRVVDGDTAVIALTGGRAEKVRFIGVDTPESTTQHEPYGEEASVFTKKHLNGKKVYLETDIDKRDKYGRLLAYIWLSQPTKADDPEIRAKMFNAKLLLDGYAQVMTIQPNSKYAEKFIAYQRDARNSARGLWGIEPGISESTPGNSPAASSGQNLTVYVTSSGTKYHRDGCRYLKNSRIPVNLNDARSKYAPCSFCSPPQ